MNLCRAVFYRVAFLVSALVIALATTFCVSVLKQNRMNAKNTYISIAKLIGTELEKPLLWDDRVAVHEAISSTIERGSAVSYACITAQGKLIEWATAGGPIPVDVAIYPQTGNPDSQIRQHSDQKGRLLYNISTPIGTSENVLHIGLLRSAIDHQKSGFFKSIIGISFSFLITGLGLAFVISRKAVQEIAALSQAIKDAGSREDEPEFSIGKSTAEIGELVTSFNRVIGERRVAQDRLQESHHFLHTAINALSHPFYVINAHDFNIILANRAALDREIAPNSRCYEITHHRTTPCDDLHHPCPLKEVIRTGKSTVVEHLHENSAGDLRYYEVHGHPIFDEHGIIVQMIEYSVDITERRLANLEREDSESRYRALIEASPDKHLRVDRSGTILDFKGDLSELIISPTSIIGGDLCDLPFSQGTQIALASFIERAIDTGVVHLHEYEVERAQGTQTFEARVSKAGPNEALCVIRDITQRKEAEDGLRRKNRELALLNFVISAASSNMAVEDLLKTTCYELARTLSLPHVAAGLVTTNQKQLEIIAEYKVEGVRSILKKQIVIDKSHLYQKNLLRLQTFISTNASTDPRIDSLREPPFNLEAESLALIPLVIEATFGGVLILISNERRRFSNFELGLVLNVAGQLSSSLAVARLNQDRQRLESAIQQIEDTVVIADLDGTIVDVNPFFEKISGYSRLEAIGAKPSILKSGEHDEAFYAELWETILRGDVWRGRLVNKKKDGTLYTEDATISPVRGSGNVITNFIAVKRDITEKEHLQKQYLQAQKMDSVGRLAGGIAHDFNNLLAAIMGYAEFSLMQIKNDHPLFEALSEIVGACDHAAGLTRQLLTFARKQTSEKAHLSLNTVIINVKRVFRHLIGTDIDLTISLEEGLRNINIDPSQIEQVVLNLIVNARDAMPNGGRLTIDTSNIDLCHEISFNGATIEAGHYVRMTVTDTGHGIVHTALDHVFEPFFSTKDTGKGTGLGLATSFGIVTEAGGVITVESELGIGSRFEVFIPIAGAACDLPPKRVVRSRIPQKTPSGCGETILLAEDDERIRQLTYRYLCNAGYDVLVASDGEVALELASDNDVVIDLVITDIVMPKIRGTELVPMLMADRPSIKVLFITGYSEIAIHIEEGDEGSFQLLEKPFSPSILVAKVREMLDS